MASRKGFYGSGAECGIWVMLAKKLAVCEASRVPEGACFSLQISPLRLSLSFCSFMLVNVLLTPTVNYGVKNPEKLPDRLDQICLILPHAFFCISVSYLDPVPAIRSGFINH